jgi:hypothetical protein
MFKHIAIAAVAAAVCAGTPAQQLSVQDRVAQRKAQVEIIKADEELYKALKSAAGAQAQGLPVIHAVMGVEGAMRARLALPSGVVNNYAVGEQVRPGMTVSAIGPRLVTVSVGSGQEARSIPLEFEAKPDPSRQQTAAGPNVPAELLGPAPRVDLSTPPIPLAQSPAKAPPPAAATRGATTAAAEGALKR